MCVLGENLGQENVLVSLMPVGLWESKILLDLGCINFKILFSEFLTVGLSHCVKNLRIRSYSGQHFPAFGLPYSVRMRENADQNNCEYGHFLRSESVPFIIERKKKFLKNSCFFVVRELG